MPLLDYVKPIWIPSRKSKLERPSETIWSTLLHLLARKLGSRDSEQLAQGHSASVWISRGLEQMSSGSHLLYPSPLQNAAPGPSKPGENEDLEF